jgi:hypothetical protein
MKLIPCLDVDEGRMQTINDFEKFGNFSLATIHFKEYYSSIINNNMY